MKRISIIFLVSLLSVTAIAQWNDCTFGEADCPGDCARFIDTDNDGICDHSQPAPEDRVSSVSTTTTTLSASKPAAKISNSYYLPQISIALIFLYLSSHFLSTHKRISIVLHRKIWNTLLSVTFLVSAILGVFLVIRLNFGTELLNIDMLFWHVEAGIAMTLIAIFHMLWHWPYFRNLLKNN